MEDLIPQHREPTPVREGVTAERDQRRVLVVEDEALIAMYVEAIIEESGYEVAGVVASLDDALRFIESHEVDSAVLDINLNGRPVYPLAEVLTKRGIPFVFASSYAPTAIPAAYRAGPLVQKPFAPSELRGALARMARPCRRVSTG